MLWRENLASFDRIFFSSLQYGSDSIFFLFILCLTVPYHQYSSTEMMCFNKKIEKGTDFENIDTIQRNGSAS